MRSTFGNATDAAYGPLTINNPSGNGDPLTSGGFALLAPAGVKALMEIAGNGLVPGTSSLSVGQSAAGVATILARGAQALNIGNASGTIAFGSAGALTITDPSGSQWGAPTGGAKGAGTINALGLFVNGVAVGTGSSAMTVNSQSAAYGLVIGDANNIVYHPTTDATARIWTIPANASVAYPIGTTLAFINDTGAGTITIAITTDTMVMVGTGGTGSRTLVANGSAVATKVTATRWQISGTNLS